MIRQRYTARTLASVPTLERDVDDWRELSACRDADPELFFVPGNADAEEEPRNAAQVAEAKAYCRACPVMDVCLRNALDDPQTVGIVGGTTTRQRKAIHRRSLDSRRRRHGNETREEVLARAIDAVVAAGKQTSLAVAN